MQETINGELLLAAHQSLLAKNSASICLLNGALHDARLMVVLAANKKVRGIKLTRPTCDCNSFKHKVRIEINQQTILESSRLGLVAIHRQVAATAIDGRQETPLQTSWKTGATTTANDSVLDHVDHIRWLHIQGFFKRFVAAGGNGLLP